MKTNEYISLITSLIAVICSLIALFHVCPRVLGFDYLGIIVGILSFLITLLLGWNIYTVVDFKNRTKEVEELKEKISKAIKLVDETGSISSSMLAERMADIYLSNNNIEEYISLKLFAISFYTKTHDYQSISRISDNLNDYIMNNKDVSSSALNDIVSYFLQVDDQLTRQLLQKVYKLSNTFLNSQS